MKEQIYFWERAENHKANEQIFQVNIEMQGGSRMPGMGFHMHKRCWFCFVDFNHLS